MRILVAPNAFKGTIPAHQAARWIAQWLREKYPQATISCCPIADGGDDTCALLGQYLQWQPCVVEVKNARGRPLTATYYLNLPTATACIDVATASGIAHLALQERNVWSASTFGTGQLICHALQKGARHIILGLGGSATIDFGLGILQALGADLYDAARNYIPPFEEQWLRKLAIIEPKNLQKIESITCLCDVDNFFFGQKGAIPVFGPQKGLLSEERNLFTENAYRIFELLKLHQPALSDGNRLGAAGGIALGLSAFYRVQVCSGADYFFNAVGIQQQIAQSDLIITGEGRYDGQSESGKGCFKLLLLAKKYSKPIWLISSGKEEELSKSGFDKVGILPPLDLSALDLDQQAVNNLKQTVLQLLDSVN
ncbi:MAG: glycerate kinase [Cytophagales bacterium]|nr:glycerate kinase [Bernardetiaceae bacterium]MDW8210732.1 glycerate kinase [Cytophagales bacterium]